MHNLASNNKHSHMHGVEGRYFSTTVLCRSVFTVTAVSSESKASWVVVMYTI